MSIAFVPAVAHAVVAVVAGAVGFAAIGLAASPAPAGHSIVTAPVHLAVRPQAGPLPVLRLPTSTPPAIGLDH